MVGVTAAGTCDGVITALAALTTPEVVRHQLETSFAQIQDTGKASKRYNLLLAEALFEQVQELADREQATVVDVMRRFIKPGLLATRLQDTPDSVLLIREHEKERELLIL